MRSWIITAIALLILPSISLHATNAEGLRAQIREKTNGFKDLRCTLAVLQANRRELEKMGKVFAETYQFKKASVCYKSPNMLKMNGELGMMKVEFITAGDVRLIRIPSVRFKKHEDITNEHEKKMTSLDVGVVSESLWGNYDIKILRTENTEGEPAVYVLRLQTPTSEKSQMVWVEDGTLKLLRRDKLFDDGSLKARMMFSDHRQVGGVWVPARVEVYNPEGKLAAVTETRDVTVNTGVEDKEFK